MFPPRRKSGRCIKLHLVSSIRMHRAMPPACPYVCMAWCLIKLTNHWFTRSEYSVTWDCKSTWYCGHYWPIVRAPDDRWWWLWRNWWNEDWQGKPKYSEKTCPSATLSTINPTWPDPGSNPGRRGGKPATNRLSYGAAISVTLMATLLSNGSVNKPQQ
jgi:hypothetical protein